MTAKEMDRMLTQKAKQGDMKVEVWNGHNIRFVYRNEEWWAVAKDICDALGHTNTTVALQMVDDDERTVMRVRCPKQSLVNLSENKKPYHNSERMAIVSESGIYALVIRSNLPEAKTFRRWVCEVIKELRKSLGLNEWEAFRLMDKEHQKQAMRKLAESLHEPVRVDYIKANIIADKAVSLMHGYNNLIKKPHMSDSMLRDREQILKDTIDLMVLNERLELEVPVSETIYRKYCPASKEVV